MNKCKYCNGDYETQETLPSDTSSIWTVLSDRGQLECDPSDTMRFTDYHANILYCPMCGRKL